MKPLLFSVVLFVLAGAIISVRSEPQPSKAGAVSPASPMLEPRPDILQHFSRMARF